MADEFAAELLEALFALEAHVLAVIPLSMLLVKDTGGLQTKWDRIITLPAVSTVSRDGRREVANIELLENLVERRTGPSVFSKEALGVLAEASGGVFRELLTLAQQACVRAAVAGRSTVEVKDTQGAVNEKAQELGLLLKSEDFDLLKEVARTNRITGDPRFAGLIDRNLIIGYAADGTWFGVHPIVRRLLEEKTSSPVGSAHVQA